MAWRVLGPVEVTDGQSGLIPLGGPKQVAVLALLLANAGRAVDTDVLVDQLWPDRPPEAGRKTVQAYVARLRRSLVEGGVPDQIRSTAAGYVLEPDPTDTDAARFERLIARARPVIETDPEAASTSFGEALGLWRGRPFENAHPTPMLDLEAARLSELRLVALEGHAESEIRAGRAWAVVAELRALVDDNPLREHSWTLLVLALYQSGRQAEALRAVGEIRLLLREELGVDPSRELRDAERAVLDHDAALDPPRRARGDGVPSQPRGRRKLGVVLAGAVVGIALIVGASLAVTAGGRDEGPRIGVRHLVPPGSTAAVAAGGAIWVLVPDASELVVFDPLSGERTVVSLAHRPSTLTAGLGSVWVASEADGHLLKFDARTQQLEREAGGLDLRGAALAVGRDAVWVVRERRDAFVRIDPDDLTATPVDFSSRFPPVLPSVVADGDLLWGSNADIGRIMWLDPVGGEFGFAGDPRLGVHAARSVTASAGSVWFSQPTNGSISRVDAASGEVATTTEVGMQSGSGFWRLRQPYELAAGPGGLWAALPEDGRVVRLDETTGEVTATLSFGEPVSVFPSAGAVWVLDALLAQLVRIDLETCEHVPFIGSGADLRGCDLSDAVLVGVDLSNADLRWATFGSTVMDGVDFTGADLLGADLRRTPLDGVIWSSTRCPDGSWSDDSGNSCSGHLSP